MYRLRVESSPERWRAFRGSVYLLLLSVAPLQVAAAFSIGGRFGIVILGLLPLMYGISAFGVEFTIHIGRKPQVFEFSADGIRIEGPGAVSRRFRWQGFRARLRGSGGRGAPMSVVFRFRSGARFGILTIDLLRHREVAETIAGYITRYAPETRPSGRIEVLRWDPSLATEGSISIMAPNFEPLFFANLAVSGPAIGVYLTASAFVIGLVTDRVLGLLMVSSYVALGVAQLAYCRREIRRGIAGAPDLRPGWRTEARLLAGVAFLGLEGLFGLRIWLA